jgi:sulfur carrier protein ThiS
VRITVTTTGRLHSVTSGTRVFDLPAGASVDDVLAALKGEDGEAAPSPQALVAVSGDHIGTVADHEQRTLVDNDEVLIFSPVAGG